MEPRTSGMVGGCSATDPHPSPALTKGGILMQEKASYTHLEWVLPLNQGSDLRVKTLLGWVWEGPQILLAANLKMEKLLDLARTGCQESLGARMTQLRPDTSSDAWQETDTLEDVRTKSFLMLLSSSWCPAPKCDHLLCKLFNYGRLLGLCKSRWVNPWHFS